MVENFHEELKAIKKDVITMGHLASDMLKDAVYALKNQDVDLAQQVIGKKQKLADMDTNIEAKAFQMIALYQPMAIDMRKLAVSLKIITYFTRIGRYGKDIANIAIELSKRKHFKKLVSIPYMAEMVNGMITDVLSSYEQEDICKLTDFDAREEDVDELRYSIFRECLSYMMEKPVRITQGTYYILVARYLERCADHATKSAEKIYYMVTGDHIEFENISCEMKQNRD